MLNFLYLFLNHKSFDNGKLNSLDESIDAERFTSIDIRIYDLEKDIKNFFKL